MFKNLLATSLFALVATVGLIFITSGSARAQVKDNEFSDADKKFMNDAAMGGMAEVKLGQLAVDKGASDQVKKFGQKMVDDHGKANSELMEFAKSHNVELPADVGKHQKTIDKLSKLSGADFDKEYVKQMVDDHKHDVKAFEKEVERGQDSDLKTWASKTLPTLQEHLTMIQDIDKSMNGK